LSEAKNLNEKDPKSLPLDGVWKINWVIKLAMFLWIPACAGMTLCVYSLFLRKQESTLSDYPII